MSEFYPPAKATTQDDTPNLFTSTDEEGNHPNPDPEIIELHVSEARTLYNVLQAVVEADDLTDSHPVKRDAAAWAAALNSRIFRASEAAAAEFIGES